MQAEALLLFVLFTVLQPAVVSPVAVNKYININNKTTDNWSTDKLVDSPPAPNDRPILAGGHLIKHRRTMCI